MSMSYTDCVVDKYPHHMSKTVNKRLLMYCKYIEHKINNNIVKVVIFIYWYICSFITVILYYVSDMGCLGSTEVCIVKSKSCYTPYSKMAAVSDDLGRVA